MDEILEITLLKVAGGTLDLTYLRRVSAILGVNELLDEALRSGAA